MDNQVILHPAIQIRSGGYFDFTDPRADVFTIEDIAHALSYTCRFGGHTKSFYSVAQHSVMVSEIVPPEDAFAALMHDAAEAFVGDIPLPLKRLLPDYAAIERQVEDTVFKKFGIERPLSKSIKDADLVLLATERRDLMPNTTEIWPIIADVKPLRQVIQTWAPKWAQRRFLERFKQLQRKLPSPIAEAS